MNGAMQAYREDRESGFTLIELLVVVIIIGILAAIAIPAFLNQRENAWRSAVESDLRNLAVEYEGEATQNNGDYPLTNPAYSASDDVTITENGNTTTQFCLEGEHASITAGDVGSSTNPIIYDSDDGGLADNTAGC